MLISIPTHHPLPFPTKEERVRRVVQIAGNMYRVIRVVPTSLATWSSTRREVHVIGLMGLEPATLGGCSLGCMVLGICGCAALWCNSSNAHSNNNVQTIHEQFNAMLMIRIGSLGRCFSKWMLLARIKQCHYAWGSAGPKQNAAGRQPQMI